MVFLSKGVHRLSCLPFDKRLYLTGDAIAFMLSSLAFIIQGAGIQETTENLIAGFQNLRSLGGQVSNDLIES